MSDEIETIRNKFEDLKTEVYDLKYKVCDQDIRESQLRYIFDEKLNLLYDLINVLLENK